MGSSQSSPMSSFTPMPTSGAGGTSQMPQDPSSMFQYNWTSDPNGAGNYVNPNMNLNFLTPQAQAEANMWMASQGGGGGTPSAGTGTGAGTGGFDISALTKLLGGMSNPVTTNISGGEGGRGGKYDTLKVQGTQWQPQGGNGLADMFKKMKGWGR